MEYLNGKKWKKMENNKSITIILIMDKPLKDDNLSLSERVYKIGDYTDNETKIDIYNDIIKNITQLFFPIEGNFNLWVDN